MSIGNLLKQGFILPAINSNNKIETLATVTKTNESTNTCDIIYVDKNGNKSNRKNVPVRLHGSGTEWFPSVNEKVIIELTSCSCIIIARHIGNYDMDVRAKMELKQDISSDNDACINAGGEIA